MIVTGVWNRWQDCEQVVLVADDVAEAAVLQAFLKAMQKPYPARRLEDLLASVALNTTKEEK